jgi:hypothetical protein
MIKNIIKSTLIAILINSCANFNNKYVTVPIKSTPSGASIYIDNRYLGQTPTTVKLVPDRNYQATIIKKGYGSSTIDMETWYSVRGGRGGDTTRCALDALGVMLIIPIFSFYSVKCRDFKKSEYAVNIGNNDYMGNEQNNNHNNRSNYQNNYQQQRGGRNLNNDQEYEYVTPQQNSNNQYQQNKGTKNYYGGESAGYYNKYYNQ